MPPQQKQSGARRRPSQSTGPLRRKSCYFCKEKIEEVDYKNYNQLRRYVSEKGKIRSRRITGACRRHQEQIAVAGQARARDGAPAVRLGVAHGRHPPERRREGRAARRRGLGLARLHAQLPRPRRLAEEATPARVAELEQARRAARPARGAELRDAQKIADALGKASFAST
jgi:small subunit ribosomal protein S18